MARNRGWLIVGLSLCGLACSQESDSPPFPGSVTSATGTPPADTGATTADSTTGQDDTGGGDSGGDGATTADPSTSAGTDDSGGDDGSFLVPGDMGGPGEDGQPPGGQYSHCTVPQDCPGLAGCLTDDGDPNDGFCSDECTDATTCDPSPGGTSQAACIEINDDAGGTVSICALDCAGGGECPGGMMCKKQSQVVTGTDEICV